METINYESMVFMDTGAGVEPLHCGNPVLNYWVVLRPMAALIRQVTADLPPEPLSGPGRACEKRFPIYGFWLV